MSMFAEVEGTLSPSVWSNERVMLAGNHFERIKVDGHVYVLDIQADGLIGNIRDEMQARINELEQQLAEAKHWEPVPDGMTWESKQETIIVATNNGQALVLEIASLKIVLDINFDAVAICRRVVPTTGERHADLGGNTVDERRNQRDVCQVDTAAWVSLVGFNHKLLRRSR